MARPAAGRGGGPSGRSPQSVWRALHPRARHVRRPSFAHAHVCAPTRACPGAGWAALRRGPAATRNTLARFVAAPCARRRRGRAGAPPSAGYVALGVPKLCPPTVHRNRAEMSHQHSCAPLSACPPRTRAPVTAPEAATKPLRAFCHVSGPARGRGPLHSGESSGPLTDAPAPEWSVIRARPPLAAPLGPPWPWGRARGARPHPLREPSPPGAVLGAFPEPCAAVSWGDGPTFSRCYSPAAC